jgi:AcrR family transcriptional regulator
MEPGGNDTDNSKRRILDAAADAFMSQGFGSTTIDDIAESVGATKGLIYYHFRSKFDIFLAVYEYGMLQVNSKTSPLALSPAPGYTRLVSMSVEHLVNLMSNVAYHHVVHQGVREQNSSALKPRQREKLLALNGMRTEYEEMFLRVMQEGINDGSIRNITPALATRTLLSSLNAVDQWFRRKNGQSDAEIRALATEIVDILLTGLAVTPQQ